MGHHFSPYGLCGLLGLEPGKESLMCAHAAEQVGLFPKISVVGVG